MFKLHKRRNFYVPFNLIVFGTFVFLSILIILVYFTRSQIALSLGYPTFRFLYGTIDSVIYMAEKAKQEALNIGEGNSLFDIAASYVAAPMKMFVGLIFGRYVEDASKKMLEKFEKMTHMNRFEVLQMGGGLYTYLINTSKDGLEIEKEIATIVNDDLTFLMGGRYIPYYVEPEKFGEDYYSSPSAFLIKKIVVSSINASNISFVFEYFLSHIYPFIPVFVAMDKSVLNTNKFVMDVYYVIYREIPYKENKRVKGYLNLLAKSFFYNITYNLFVESLDERKSKFLVYKGICSSFGLMNSLLPLSFILGSDYGLYSSNYKGFIRDRMLADLDWKIFTIRFPREYLFNISKVGEENFMDSFLSKFLNFIPFFASSEDTSYYIDLISSRIVKYVLKEKGIEEVKPMFYNNLFTYRIFNAISNVIYLLSSKESSNLNDRDIYLYYDILSRFLVIGDKIRYTEERFLDLINKRKKVLEELINNTYDEIERSVESYSIYIEKDPILKYSGIANYIKGKLENLNITECKNLNYVDKLDCCKRKVKEMVEFLVGDPNFQEIRKIYNVTRFYYESQTILSVDKDLMNFIVRPTFYDYFYGEKVSLLSKFLIYLSPLTLLSSVSFIASGVPFLYDTIRIFSKFCDIYDVIYNQGINDFIICPNFLDLTTRCIDMSTGEYRMVILDYFSNPNCRIYSFDVENSVFECDFGSWIFMTKLYNRIITPEDPLLKGSILFIFIYSF